MSITYYKSNKLMATETVEVSEILMQTEPEFMTDEERAAINRGEQTPMLCFVHPATGAMLCVPVEFAIKIEG